MAKRLRGMGLPQYQSVVDGKGWTGEIAFVPDALEKPLRWRRPRRVFVGSMTDLFHPNVPIPTINSIVSVMVRAKQHRFQLLTKRPDMVLDWQGHSGWTLPENVWMGVTCERSDYSWRCSYLAWIPATVRFVSFEPLLGSFENHPGVLDYADWAIVGCESGPKRRPCKIEWALDLVRQCKAAGVAVFVKQLDIDGRVSHDPAEWPAELRVREYPR